MAMDLVPLLATLIQQGQLEKRPNIGTFTRKRDEERHIGAIVLGALAIRVEVDRPIVPTNRENVGSYVLPNPNSFGQRVPSDLETVRALHGVGDRRRRGGRRRR